MMNSTQKTGAIPKTRRRAIIKDEDGRLKNTLTVPEILHANNLESQKMISIPNDIVEKLFQEKLFKNATQEVPGSMCIINSPNVHWGPSFSFTEEVRKEPAKNVESLEMKKKVKKKYRALQGCNEPIEIEDINAVTHHIGKGWRDLGRKLGYTDGQLDQYEFNHKHFNLKDILYKMLLDWKRNDDKATVHRLSKNLYKAEEYSALDMLYKSRFKSP